ncbi:MAG: SLC13 family permease [Candidatus Thermoplasmatota archaeon]
MDEKIIALLVFVICYSMAISRKIKIVYPAIISAILLILLDIVPARYALFEAIKWDVLAIYWGFMMVSYIFLESGVPSFIAHKIIKKFKKEKYVIFVLCAITAFISSFMENVGVVLIMAPVAIEVAKRLKSNLFYYLVPIAISSNVATTVTMIADPPSIILAIETGMKFFDFYWFSNKISIGTLSIFGVISALLSLLLIFRKMNKSFEMEDEKIRVDYIPSIIFIGGVLALAICPYFGIKVGIVGLTVGLISLAFGRKNLKKMIFEFDWNSFFFITGIFVVVSSLELTGLLSDFSKWFGKIGIKSSSIMVAMIVWLSVAISSFVDNVPYTIIMIPVCRQIASILSISPYPLLFGMLIGTGIGGNITPIGATANVFACGILEKNGYKIKLKEYLKISLPFTLIAVAVSHLFLQIIWL